MKYLINSLIRSAAMAALITGTATCAFGAEKSAGDSRADSAITAPATNTRTYPFRGTVGTTDPTAKTITLAGKKSNRVLKVDDGTKLSRDGKEVALADLQSGDYLKGLLSKSDGQEILVKASIGEKPERQPRANPAPRRAAKTAPNDSSSTD